MLLMHVAAFKFQIIGLLDLSISRAAVGSADSHARAGLGLASIVDGVVSTTFAGHNEQQTSPRLDNKRRQVNQMFVFVLVRWETFVCKPNGTHLAHIRSIAEPVSYLAANFR